MPYIIYDSKEVYFWTKGNGEPLLFLHGNTASSLYFEDDVNLLYKKFKTILIDYPGHGKSERLDSFPINFWEYNARCSLALLDYLNIEKTFVIAVSGGALVALNMALIAPERIKKIVIDNFPGEFFTKEDVDKIIEKRRYLLGQKGNYLWENMHGKDYKNILKNDEELLLNAIDKQNLLCDDISKIQVPVLFCADMTEPDFDTLIEKTLSASKKMKNSLVMYYSDKKYDPTFAFSNMAFNFFKNKNLENLNLKKDIN